MQECAVIAREDITGDKRLVAYLVPSPGSRLDFAALYDWVGKQLPDYMIPAAFVEMPRLPLSPNGKVDRKNLPAPEYPRSALAGEYQPPRTPAEEVMAGIWAEVLKLERVGAYDQFFELGGHSLLATQVISRVRHAFQVELPLRALFEAPTVARLSSAETLHASSKDCWLRPFSRYRAPSRCRFPLPSSACGSWTDWNQIARPITFPTLSG